MLIVANAVLRAIRQAARRTTIVVMFAIGPVASADDIMRCRNGAIIRIGMVAPEVAGRCGEPKHRAVSEVPVRVRTPTGTLAMTGWTQIERWTYDRGYAQFPALLVFDDGKLKSIELLTGQ